MKSFKSVQIVKVPMDSIWVIIRDHLDQLVPQLPDIQSVTVQHRSEPAEGEIALVNLWQAKANLPAILSSIIKPEALAWTDRATWNITDNICTWQIELHFAKDRSRCYGKTIFEPALGGKGCRITFSGDFEVNAAGLPGVPSLLEGAVAAAAESFVGSLIPTNFRKLAAVAESVAASKLPG